MENKIDISVIVPVFNIEKYIGQCLDSILSQTGVNFEVICIDDASKDSSLDVLERYQANDERIKVIRNKENKGPASTRNAGFRIAQGEYVYSIDGDDMLVEGALQKMYEYAKNNDLDLLGFSAISFFENDTLRKGIREDEYVRKNSCFVISKGIDLFVTLHESGEYVIANLCLYCIRNKFYRDNDLYDVEGVRYADDSMFLKYMKAQRAMCVPDVLYRRRYREGSVVTSPMKRIYLESLIVVFVREFCYWQQMNLSQHQNEVLSKYFLGRLQEIDSMSYLFRNDRTEMEYLNKHFAAYFLYEKILKSKLLYEDRITEAEKNSILSASNLIIYGAGYYAEKVTDILEVYNKQDYTVVISGEPNGEYLKGHRVYNVRNAYKIGMLKDALVIVAISHKYKTEIEDILRESNISETIWFDK